MVYPVHVSNENFENYVNLLLKTEGNKLHYVYIKDFNDLSEIREKVIIKNTLQNCLQCFNSERALTEHTEN